MLDSRRILAVVPARGGSAGIPLKNVRPVLGIPMVARVGAVVRAVPMIDRAVVSTDHDGIAEVAETAGLAAPFRRPAELSGARIGDWDVLDHALREMERIDEVPYDIILMLQPTSPLRRPEHVEATIRMLADEGWDAVWTVSQTDSKEHPLKQLTIEAGRLDYYDPQGRDVVARQQLEPIYHRNGVAYAMTRDCLLKQRTIMGVRTGALVLDGHFVSIDTEWDIALVEFIMRQQGWPEGAAN
jgi:CMP-N,N'-diacetyllegionaminic acid synthase